MTSLAIALAMDALVAASLVAIAAVVAGRPRGACVALALAVGAAGALAIGIGGRGAAIGQWPLTNRFEFGLWFALAVLLMCGILLATRYPPTVAALLLPLGALVLATTTLAVGPAERALQPAPAVLRSIWLQIHVLAAALGYGTGASAGALGIAFLVRTRLMAAEPIDARREGEAGERISMPRQGEATPSCAVGEPDPGCLAQAMNVAVEIAFPALSAAIVTGMIWAQSAWGEAWSWFPKEIWALVTWLLYLAFLHARGLRDWRPRLPWLAVLGLAAIAFTLVGVPWLARATTVAEPHVFWRP